MEEFNYIDDLKKKAKVYSNRYYVFGFSGDINDWAVDSYFFEGSQVKYKSFSDRKNESDRRVGATILIYDSLNGSSLEDKWMYRNSRGVYFKKKDKKFYVAEGKLNEKLTLS